MATPIIVQNYPGRQNCPTRHFAPAYNLRKMAPSWQDLNLTSQSRANQVDRRPPGEKSKHRLQKKIKKKISTYVPIKIKQKNVEKPPRYIFPLTLPYQKNVDHSWLFSELDVSKKKPRAVLTLLTSQAKLLKINIFKVQLTFLA